MAVNPLFSRLENFFTSFEEEPALKKTNSESLSGWSWECDQDGKFTSCGPEVERVLHLSETDLLDQSIFLTGLHPDSVSGFKSALFGNNFPVEVAVNYRLANGSILPATIHIFSPLLAEGKKIGWRGFTQILSETTAQVSSSPAAPLIKAAPPAPSAPKAKNIPQTTPKTGTGFLPSLSPSKAAPLWDDKGQLILTTNPDLQTGSATAISHNINIGNTVTGVLEIVDHDPTRKWSKENRLLVQEVAHQLALALENAQLYAAVQRELGERVRAEKETQKRNRDLASLNQIGQQLNALTVQQDIFTYLEEIIPQLISAPNLSIAMLEQDFDTVTFPVFLLNGEKSYQQNRALAEGPLKHIIDTKSPLLFHSREAYQQKLNTGPSGKVLPKSLLGVPMTISERTLGVILLEDFEQENAFSEVDLELLSTISTQAATSLQNAYLFQEMSLALNNLEIRSRYQEYSAKGVAALTEFGTTALANFLEMLGTASHADRVYFAEIQTGESGQYWHAASIWNSDPNAQQPQNDKILHIPVALYELWAKELTQKGWSTGSTSSLPSSERVLLDAQGIKSTLLLAVPGRNQIPSFLGFDQITSERAWGTEEIYALQVAANALSNTLTREDLLEQLQSSLDETEQLYNTSHRLALANDLQGMLAALTLDIKNSNINRAALLMFDYDEQGKLAAMKVSANWYSGRGTPPPAVDSELNAVDFHRYFLIPAPNYYDDIPSNHLDQPVKAYFTEQRFYSLAILPLWVSKKQIGALLLASEEFHKFTAREKRTLPPLVDQMAIAVENQRLFEQTEAALKDTETLYQLSNQIAQAAELKDHLNIVGENLLPARADQASIILVTEYNEGRPEELTVAGVYDAHTKYRPANRKIKYENLPFISQLGNKTISIADVPNSALDPISKDTLLKSNLYSITWIPMRSAGQLLGFINISSSHAGPFQDEELRLLEAAANGIAVALERQKLLVEAQRRALEMQTAAELARDTTGALTLDVLLPRFIHLLCERFDFQNASIYLMNETSDFVSIRESTSLALKQTNKLAVGSNSLIGQVTAQGQPIVINNILESPFEFHTTLLPETRSDLCIPLKLGNRTLGALDIQSTRFGAFSPDDITVMQVLADQIAIAIDNARAYELSQLAIKEMEEVDRLKSQFLANMSHELRTPLNSIIGFSRVILKGIDGEINDIQKQDLSAIYNSGQHLLHLINDILDLSKIEAGKMQLSFSEVDLPEIITSVMSTATGLVKDKPVKLETDISDSLPPVFGDPTRIRQVLLNFVSNAAKFTEEGFVRVKAFPASAPDGTAEVMIEVSDSGIGIEPQDQAKLFQAFSQVDDSPTRKTGGTGLGLSISRSFVELLGGRIGIARSEINQGSTFFFTLPVSGVPLTLAQPEKDKIGTRPENIILSIDDEEQIVQLYQRYLSDLDYTIIPLSHPKDALQKAKELRPMAITLDVMMPEKDGWTVLRELKSDPQTAHIPVIICSILEEKEKGLHMGAAAYLVKPFLKDELVQVINQLHTNGKPRQIFVINDSESDQQVIHKTLEELNNLQVLSFQNASAGLAAMAKARPDVLILDLFMQEMDGFEVLEQIQTDPFLTDLPVILLTSTDLTAEQHARITQAGTLLLPKDSIREGDLINAVTQAIRASNKN